MKAFVPNEPFRTRSRHRVVLSQRNRARAAATGVVLPAACLIFTTLVAQGQTSRVKLPIIKAAVAPAHQPLPSSAVVDTFCVGCHSGPDPAGQFDFRSLQTGHPERDSRSWEKALLQIRAGLMPPAGAPRPPQKDLDAFARAIETRIDRAAARHPNPGAPLLHRLNRTEYANSVRDLLGLDVDVTPFLPPDDMSHGFDNMAEVLNVSPTLLAGYVRTAGKISRAALGDPKAQPGEDIYHVPSPLSQTAHVDGTPFGTRGGMVIRHNFPADGEYVFSPSLYFTTNALLFGSTQIGEQLEVAVNNRRVALFPVNPRMKGDDVLQTLPVKVKAGPQIITVAFVQKASGPVEDFVQPFDHSLGDLFLGRTQGLTGLPHLRDVSIKGPYHVTGVSQTPARKRIFTQWPTSASDELPAAKQILTNLATQAYRRPLSSADTQNLVRAYQTGRGTKGTFDDGIQLGVQYLLSSPQFVFRFERTPSKLSPETNYKISEYELASRLSYFLWSSAPDARLRQLARQNKLRKPGVLEGEVRRMLADPRAQALSTNFAGQWLHLRNLDAIQPDLFAYPNANANLLHAMRRETELFFGDMVQNDRPITDLLDSDTTFVNESLAKLYHLPDVEGTRFRRVTLADPNRRGLLGQASVLTVTSFANRTSPVVRGKWVLDNLLGAPPPRQPANIPPLEEIAGNTPPQSVRARLEAHRSNPACASCHTMMDPIGFSLENFDAIGAWRIRDNGFKINSHGQLVDGTPVDSPQSLRQSLLHRAPAFRANFTQKLMTYALGRGTEYYDMPAVRAVDRNAAKHNYRFSAYVLGIVQSVPFQMRRSPAPAKPTAPKAMAQTASR